MGPASWPAWPGASPGSQPDPFGPPVVHATWAPPPPPRRPQRRWWVFVTVLMVGALAIAVGVLVTTFGEGDTASPSPSSQPSPNDTLVAANLLLSDAEVSTVMDASMESDAVDVNPDTGVVVDPSQCTGAFKAVDNVTLAGPSRYVTMASKVVETQPVPVRRVVQGAGIHSSSLSAQTFFDRQRDDWTACAGQTVTAKAVPSGTVEARATLGAPEVGDDMITLFYSTGTQQCQRALAVVTNVIVDVSACGSNVTSQAADIAADIVAKVG